MQESKHYLFTVNREINTNGNVIEFERLYHTKAESAESAMINLNKFLLANLGFDHFPDSFFADLSIVDSFHANVNEDQNMEIYVLLSLYKEENEGIPIKEKRIVFDEDSENYAYPKSPDIISESFYKEASLLFTIIEV